MARLISLLRRRGFSILKLTVRLENTTAIALYRKLGFVRERRINGHYEDEWSTRLCGSRMAL